MHTHTDGTEERDPEKRERTFLERPFMSTRPALGTEAAE